ncbi:MAG: peptidylprolyl isomerase [Candidatus Levyibacteriota bacterium]
MFDNKAIIGFIIVVLLGLGIAIYVSGKSNPSPSNTPDISAIESPSPAITIPEGANNINQPNQTNQMNQENAKPTMTPISATKGIIKTVKGDIEFVLYPNDAPKTVTNFATLAANKFYDGLTFHRVEPGFVIQGGDPNGNGTGGTSIYGATFEDELNPNTESYKEGYKEGVIAMANRGPNTNSSQFFIMWSDNTGLPKNYTIFGKVTNGMDVVHKMVAGDKILSITVE